MNSVLVVEAVEAPRQCHSASHIGEVCVVSLPLPSVTAEDSVSCWPGCGDEGEKHGSVLGNLDASEPREP
ncbi:hypothetical protein E2C01_028050 [Portunus trituberculatus]|uniref:Uncharacterized protein n=1 Tax=Portunus trituberculatus TaxID=210409 RepID=A0A5B7EQK8_PORTR|nr:hypothetical protein [Portunus trituberculatus]